MGKYIYAIIDESEKKELLRLPEGALETIPCRKLSAVTRDAPVKILEGTQEELLDHNNCILKLMDSYAVLPVSFGTIASSEQEIINLLTLAYHPFEEAIRQLQWKVEFDVEVYWSEEEALERLVRHDPQIVELQKSLSRKGSALQIEDKLEFGKIAAEVLEKKKNEILSEIRKTLKAVSVSSANLPRSRACSSIINLACLVVRQDSEIFEKAIYSLDEKFGGHLKFKYSGPLPPYSFTGIKIQMVTPRDINEAKTRLQLTGSLTQEKLKSAYWKLSKQYHPDTLQELKTHEENFKKIAASYKLLESFCENYGYGDNEKKLTQQVILVTRVSIEDIYEREL